MDKKSLTIVLITQQQGMFVSAMQISSSIEVARQVVVVHVAPSSS